MEVFLRTESMKPDQIAELSVISPSDKSIISALKSVEPCLLEGSRGTGKSFLMKIAEAEIESEGNNALTVFISFSSSSLVTTGEPLQFYHWMLAKTLRALINKLRKKGHSISQFAANLLSNDELSEDDTVEHSLKEIVKLFEDSYRGKIAPDLSSLPDIEDVKDAIEEICEKNSLERIYFFFDEAAHVFRPNQQRQFFNLFKDLRSPFISCNAAIYPGVTYFGDSFEPSHDCIYRKLERSIADKDYLDYFEKIVLKQVDDKFKEAIENQKSAFNTLILSCGGNPRNLLKTIQDLNKVNSSEINRVIKEFYRSTIWADHTELGDKYKGHQKLIDWGRDFLETQVIPGIESYNTARKEKGVDEATIYFWIHKDSPASVKESLRLLSYTGIIRKIDTSYRATRSEIGARYEVKYGCIISSESSPTKESQIFFRNLSVKKFPEFGKNHRAYSEIKNIESHQLSEEQYSAALSEMLQKSIDVLYLLTDWQKSKLKNAGILTIEDLHAKSEEELIERIYRIGPVRARIMKNAANAELLEYLSG